MCHTCDQLTTSLILRLKDIMHVYKNYFGTYSRKAGENKYCINIITYLLTINISDDHLLKMESNIHSGHKFIGVICNHFLHPAGESSWAQKPLFVLQRPPTQIIKQQPLILYNLTHCHLTWFFIHHNLGKIGW